MMKSKLHRATVTEANLHYEGSLTIDRDLLEAADILPHEQIHVWDVTNGTRLVTYALEGPRGSGVICVNGAGAHLIKPGHIIIIATFTSLSTKKAKKHEPTVIFLDGQNAIREISSTEVAESNDAAEALAPTPEPVAPAPKRTPKSRPKVRSKPG
jgi:aspartate 1-decarboxylase